MFDNDDFIEGMGCLGVIVMAVLLVIFAPMLSFFICYFGGWLCKITFGPTLCNALNTLFNVSFLHQRSYLLWQVLLDGLVAILKILQ